MPQDKSERAQQKKLVHMLCYNLIFSQNNLYHLSWIYNRNIKTRVRYEDYEKLSPTARIRVDSILKLLLPYLLAAGVDLRNAYFTSRLIAIAGIGAGNVCVCLPTTYAPTLLLLFILLLLDLQ